jgi:hypothetical protein
MKEQGFFSANVFVHGIGILYLHKTNKNYLKHGEGGRVKGYLTLFFF